MHAVNAILKIIRQVQLSARTENKTNIIVCTHFLIFDIQSIPIQIIHILLPLICAFVYAYK